MGKNQQHKAQQRSKHAGDGEDLPDGDTSVDVSFHTPEWHAARLAALTTERKTWEEWKLEQKQAASALAAVEEDEDRQNREYKAQLAADRVAKLSGGTNHADQLNVRSGKVSKKSHRSKDKKSHKSEKISKKQKDSKHSKKKHKSHDKDHKSRRKHAHSSESSETTSNDNDDKQLSKEGKGPVRLSEFLKE
ncbi:hypothetical protein ABBQ32_000245 [Trebouxia sp. C0010 RCD-2024]